MIEPLTIYLLKVGVVNLKLTLGPKGPLVEFDIPTEEKSATSRVFFDQEQFADLSEAIGWVNRKIKEHGKI